MPEHDEAEQQLAHANAGRIAAGTVIRRHHEKKEL